MMTSSFESDEKYSIPPQLSSMAFYSNDGPEISEMHSTDMQSTEIHSTPTQLYFQLLVIHPLKLNVTFSTDSSGNYYYLLLFIIIYYYLLLFIINIIIY